MHHIDNAMNKSDIKEERHHLNRWGNIRQGYYKLYHELWIRKVFVGKKYDIHFEYNQCGQDLYL